MKSSFSRFEYICTLRNKPVFNFTSISWKNYQNPNKHSLELAFTFFLLKLYIKKGVLFISLPSNKKYVSVL